MSVEMTVKIVGMGEHRECFLKRGQRFAQILSALLRRWQHLPRVCARGVMGRF
jgi:hypothetical protein